MNHKILYLRKVFLLLFIGILFSSVLTAQKRPESVPLDPNTDDDILCGVKTRNDRKKSDGQLAGTRFCDLYAQYKQGIENYNSFQTTRTERNLAGLRSARDARNEMIELTRGQIDGFYKDRKDNRSKKIRVFETILDFLNIGGNLAATIMNGARGKTITNAALSSIETGRTSFNENFKVLQTQVLINKMNTRRAEILTEIVGNIDKVPTGELPSQSYTWYGAKNDLRRYLIAGTFDDALDTLVEETGSEVKEAERKLRQVEKRSLVTEFSEEDTQLVDDASEVLENLQTSITANADDADANEKLQNIVIRLREIPELGFFFAGRSITAQTSNKELYNAIIVLRREIFRRNERALMRTVEETVVKLGQ